jgi:hypothetical protein
MDALVRLSALQQVAVNQHSTAEAKITLFRSLFHGREDVYPRRFESRKTGRAGYSPVCGNEWVPGICEKPRIKCSECSRQRFLPVTDDAIRWHLQGHDDHSRDFINRRGLSCDISRYFTDVAPCCRKKYPQQQRTRDHRSV